MNFTLQVRQNERIAVFELQDGKLEIHKDGIVWKKSEKKSWQEVLGMSEPSLSAYAEVPLKFLNEQDRPNNVPAIVADDYVHFWIAEPKRSDRRRRIGRLFVDHEGVVIKVARRKKRETWDQFKTRLTRATDHRPTP